MKLFYALLVLLILSNCSFDKKSGIWKNDDNINLKKNKNIFKDFKEVNTTIKPYKETITLNKNFNFNIGEPFPNRNWSDIYFNKYNNLKNLQFNGLNKVSFKSKKLTRHKVDKYTLFENNNFILHDNKGNIIVYSLKLKTIILKFNFYKKKYKNFQKQLNLIVENGVIYVSDNIGYIYAYNYNSEKLLWAKNYKKPFRSNIKLSLNNLVTSNQNNDLFILDKKKGNLKKLIPSEETAINNKFKNNIVLSDQKIFFLNTYGSLYSVDNNTLELNWFINLNKSLDLSLNNLFYGSNPVYYKNNIFVSSNESFYVLNSVTGSILSKKSYSSFLRPILINNYIFLISKNNYLLAIDIQSGEIIYSYDVAQKVSDFKNTKKQELKIKNFYLVNSKILIFLENSKLIQFDESGEIEKIYKLPSKLNSSPIFVNKSLIFLDRKNRLLIIN